MTKLLQLIGAQDYDGARALLMGEKDIEDLRAQALEVLDVLAGYDGAPLPSCDPGPSDAEVDEVAAAIAEHEDEAEAAAQRMDEERRRTAN